MRSSASSREQPSRAIWRAICASSGAQTTTVASNSSRAALPVPALRPSKSSGMSSTSTATPSLRACATRRAISAPTPGWTIAPRRARAAASRNTIAPSAARSRRPPGPITSGSERGRDLGQHRGPRGLQLVHDRVGVDHARAERGEQTRDGALARADAAAEPDHERHAVSMPCGRRAGHRRSRELKRPGRRPRARCAAPPRRRPSRSSFRSPWRGRAPGRLR